MHCFRTSSRAGFAAAFLSVLGASASARAITLDFAALGVDPNSLIDESVRKSLTSTIGFGTQHRPYEPASPLGVSVGLDASVEVTLFKIPESLFENLSALGFPSSSPLPALPVAKLHLHKGFGERFDLGGSFFYLQSNWLIGGDAKITLVQGEEGPTWAFRFCYSYTSVAFSPILMSTKVFSPQLLVSRKMEFADPYLGIALAYARGSISLELPSDVASQLPTSVAVAPYEYSVAQAYTGYVFGGVSLRIPHSGLRMTVEGAYDIGGIHTMGTKIGFTF
jgi:hypothetical protein